MTTPQFYQGTGRRKTSVARVRLVAGDGEVVVNGRSLEEHFGNAVSLPELLMPFRVTNTEGRFNAMVKVEGGGSQGQSGAIRHGIARALLDADPEARLGFGYVINRPGDRWQVPRTRRLLGALREALGVLPAR